MALLVCPMCKTKVKPLDKAGDAQGYDCPNCGRFRVASSVFAEVANQKRSGRDWEEALNKAKARQPGVWAPTITTYDFL